MLVFVMIFVSIGIVALFLAAHLLDHHAGVHEPRKREDVPQWINEGSVG